MTPYTVIFLLLNAATLLVLPRRFALLPLLVGCCYMTTSQRVDIGPISLNVIRILVAVGFLRIVIRGEKISSGICGMDKLVLVWMAWLVVSSAIHPGESPLVFNLGIAFNVAGIYFLIRVFCASHQEMLDIVKLTAWLLVPLAIAMTSERLTGRNMFEAFGGITLQREDKVRAVGPFGHAILAGSVGASCFPLLISIWKESRITAVVGLVACLAIVVASNSSGPLMSLIFAIGALLLWKRCDWMPYVRWGSVACYFGLEIIMERPAYYILDSIDLAGGSTGWHRAYLIQTAFEHIGEWWLAGTNYTRHWMPTGVSWSPDHCDVTNYYLLMGVWAGLPLMLLFIAMIWTGFRYIRGILKSSTQDVEKESFITWCLGSSLFAHAATCVSVAYFDQSYIFMFMCLAIIASLHLLVREGELDEGILMEVDPHNTPIGLATGG